MKASWLEFLAGIHQYFVANAIYVRNKPRTSGFKGRNTNYVNNEQLLVLKAINTII